MAALQLNYASAGIHHLLVEALTKETERKKKMTKILHTILWAFQTNIEVLISDVQPFCKVVKI